MHHSKVTARRTRLLSAVLALSLPLATACAAADDEESASEDITAAKVNGGTTGAFLRQVTAPGFTRIQSTVTVPDYLTRDNPTPWIYYGFDDGQIDVEAGLAFQQGTADQILRRRYRAYLRRGKQFWFADETDRVLPGATVKFAAEYVNGKVIIEQDGRRLTLRNATGSATDGLAVSFKVSSLRARRVVGLARSNDDYKGQALPTLGPTVFSDTKISDKNGQTFAFEGERANWADVSGSGIRYGTIAWPASGVHRVREGTRETITLF